jgi:hypothetical protein
MKKYHQPVLVLILTIGQIICEARLFAQQVKKQPSTVVAVRKFSGFSEILSIDTLIHDLNVLNNDKSVLYVKYIGGIRADYIVDVKSQYSFPKKIVKQTFGSLTDIASPGGAYYYSDEVYVPNYSGEVRGVRPIGSYYNNEFSLYDFKDSGIGIGTFSLSISQPGLQGKPAYKKAVYLEDAALLIEESLFDEVVSNMFSYFRRQAGPEKSLY